MRSKLLPQRLKDSLKVLLGRAAIAPALHEEQRFSCPVCGARGVTFAPLPMYYFRELHKHRFVLSIFEMETLNLEFYSCSVCGAADRERLYALYFRRNVLPEASAVSILDIAPAQALSRFLKSCPQLNVRTADISMAGVDDVIDITNMRLYKDGQFDAFICSHVLEHVPDDRQAMRELYRIVRPGGWGIAMVPINLALQEIHEDSSIVDEASRWKYFAQNDHVRMYSKRGFVERLESVGFRVRQLTGTDFGAGTLESHGIDPRSVLYVATK